MNCKEAAYWLQLTLAKLAEVQEEKELLRWKLLWAVRLPHLEPCSFLLTPPPAPPLEHILNLPSYLKEMGSPQDQELFGEEPGLSATSEWGWDKRSW